MDKKWTPQEIATLTQKWAAGIPSAVIGTALNRSGDAITAKARHLGLPRRPSPIVRNIDKMADMLSEGDGVSDIAKALRISFPEAMRLFDRIRNELGPQAI